MALTSPNQIYSPDPNEIGNIPVATKAMADSIQREFTRRSGTGIATRNSNITLPNTASPSPVPLTDFTVEGETIEAVSNGFRVLRAGPYLVTGMARFGNNPNGRRGVGVSVNGGSGSGAANAAAYGNATQGDHSTTMTFSTFLVLDANDVITMWSWQNSGGTLPEEAVRLGVARLS